jgi:HD-GYP domain-containing protein (c-di-GMP phosphodiesterase class II)
MSPGASKDLRLAELLASLSLATDLAARHPTDEALRACILATRLAAEMGLGLDEVSHVYYTTLLRFVGCTAPMPDYAATLGEIDVQMRPRGDMTDMTNPREAFGLLTSLGADQPAWRRPGIWARVVARGRSVAQVGVRADCEVAVRMATRFHLDDAVAQSLNQTFERWDGHGMPNGLGQEAITLPARFGAVGFAAAMFFDSGGRQEAMDALGRWSGKILDPAIVDGFLKRPEVLDSVDGVDAWDVALECEPQPRRVLAETRLDDVARGFADFVDLKSFYLSGHSSGVAALAEAAGRLAGMPEPELTALRRAGLLHDVGRAAVPTTVWDKAGPLTTSEWEQVRLHPYHTERILSRSAILAPLALVAGMHHERVDASGYHRGASAAAQPKPARMLAVADVYQALTEERAHRHALTSDAAARVLEAQPGLDREAVSAVLQAAGQRRRTARPGWPAGLSDREVEVLRLLARGRSMRQIGETLFISESTVHTHVAHIYEKARVSTRASAALFAMENDLLQP